MPYNSLAQIAASAIPNAHDAYLQDIQDTISRQQYTDLIGREGYVRNPITGDYEVLPVIPEGGLQEPMFTPGDVAGPAAALAKTGAKAVARAVGDDIVAMINRATAKSLDELVDFGSPYAVDAVGVTDLGGVGRRAPFPSWYYGSKDAMTPDDLYRYKTFVMPLMGRYPKTAAGERAYNKAVDYYLGMGDWDAAENPISRAIIQRTARQNVFDPVLGQYVSQVDIPKQGKKMLDAMDATDGRAVKRNWYADKLRGMVFDPEENAAETVAGLDTLDALARWAQYANNPYQDLWNRGRPVFDWVDALTYGDFWR